MDVPQAPVSGKLQIFITWQGARLKENRLQTAGGKQVAHNHVWLVTKQAD